MTTRTHPIELNGAQKSAVLCLVLGPEEAAKIFGLLSPEELEAVSREMASLPRIEADQVRDVLGEYEDAAVNADTFVEGGMGITEELLASALGEEAAAPLLERVRESAGAGKFSHLENTEPRMFANTLLEEHPQTMAVILSQLDLKLAARAVEELPPDVAADVLFRMADMEKIRPEMVALIAEGLRGRGDLTISSDMASPADAARVARMLNLTSSGKDDDLLRGIETRSGELAEKIRSLMFVFEDLLLIDGKGIQVILRDVDSKDLALALKGASPELHAHIRKNMSERAGQALEEEIELLGAVRVTDVQEAQQRIMDGVRSLEESGEVTVVRETDGDDFIA